MLYDFADMWNLIIQTGNILIGTENILVITREEGSQGGSDMSEGVSCMVMDGNQACGDDHFVAYIDLEI